MRQQDKRNKSLLKQTVAKCSFLACLYPGPSRGQAEPGTVLNSRWDALVCSFKLFCQENREQVSGQALQPGPDRSKHPPSPPLPQFCLQIKAAVETFCLFSCSILTVLILFLKKLPYSYAKALNCPKTTVSVISFKCCSEAPCWNRLCLLFQLVTRVNVTNLRPHRAGKYVRADKGNRKSHQRYNSEYFLFPFYSSCFCL